MGASTRRKLTLLDQFDIPLIRADGALHGVELKKAHYPRMLVTHETMALGPEVHLAVSRAQNYLAALDRQESVIRDELGLDCRRAFATVVIGHSMYCSHDSRADVSEDLRTFNSHLSRIEVITYEDLLAGAERALEITRVDVEMNHRRPSLSTTEMCGGRPPPKTARTPSRAVRSCLQAQDSAGWPGLLGWALNGPLRSWPRTPGWCRVVAHRVEEIAVRVDRPPM